ncbi:MAG: hypothetical protein WCT12_10665 [Verrucomicrobiota bacterium]
MKQIGLWLGLLLTALSPASAQVTVEITQDQDQFLPGEAIITAVRITNRSGQALRLGAEDNWLTFSVESGDREVVPKTGDVPVTGEFLLPSSKVGTKRVDLAPYFSATIPGRYSVTATLRIKDWDREITSPPRKFDIIEGAKLWEQIIGVPKSAGATNSTPEVRKYILQQAHYLKSQLRLYLRLTDASGAKAFRVVTIGPTVSFGRPEPQVDKFSNLHVLYQDQPHAFNYTVFNPDGDVILRQTYDYLGTRPRLQPDGDGKIAVAGGARRITPNDIPTPPPESLSDDGPKPPVPSPEVTPPKP